MGNSKTVLTTENIVSLSKRDGGMFCHYCGERVYHFPLDRDVFNYDPETGYITHNSKLKIAQVDHKMPKSKGGSHDLDNLVLSCHKCNQRKGAKDYDQFIEWLNVNYPNLGKFQ